MNDQDLLSTLSKLPLPAQQMVKDFIDFLYLRYSKETGSISPQIELRDEPFFGMWEDRKDLKTSREWVHEVRLREWG